MTCFLKSITDENLYRSLSSSDTNALRNLSMFVCYAFVERNHNVNYAVGDNDYAIVATLMVCYL